MAALHHVRGERGASAVLIAVSMLLLMGFAAIAIDYGLGLNERRQDQTAADNSALGAGVELIVSGDLQSAVDSIKTVTNDNLGVTVTDQQWVDCLDADALEHTAASEGLTPATSCMSFGKSDEGIAWNRIRVRVPVQTTDAVFSRVLGFVGLKTDAAAEVELDNLLTNGAFPAAVFNGGGAGDEFCIKTSPSPSNNQSCGEPSTGDFGNFQPYFYSEVSPGGISSVCTSGDQPSALSRVMADGMDHQLGFTASAPGNRINGDDCPTSGGPAFPNRVDSGAGYSNGDITDGLIKGGSFDGSFDGRLTRKIWAGYGTAQIFDQPVDNRPLWSYIDTSVINSTDHPDCVSAAAGPDTNNGSQEAAYVAAHADLLNCLSSANVPDGLFVADLYQSPRLTIVPIFHQSAPLGSNACCYDVKDFVPVFINGVWTATGPQWTCDGGMIDDPVGGYCKHEPGRTGQISVSALGQQKVDSANAIVLSCGVLPGLDEPEEKCKKVESGGAFVDVYLNLFLVK